MSVLNPPLTRSTVEFAATVIAVEAYVDAPLSTPLIEGAEPAAPRLIGEVKTPLASSA